MRNLIIISLLSILFFSCQRDDNMLTPPDKGADKLSVNVDIKSNIIVESKANIPITTQDIQTLYLLVFSQDGYFISKHQGLANSTSNYTFNDITLSGVNNRILHFVANYDWSTFADNNYINKHENEVINTLTTGDGNQTFWQRVVVTGGFNTPSGGTYVLPETVHLLRNMAKVTVVNNTSNSSQQYYITDLTYAMGDYYSKGSVAPFNTTTELFDINSITEAYNGTEQTILEANFNINPKLIYERQNSIARKSTYIIIKAKYRKVGTTTNPAFSYYKIDIANQDDDKLLDLKRNYHYIININKVLKDGYSTLQDAMQNAASNNINASVAVSEYTSISNGSDVLQVEKSSFTYIKQNTPFSISYSYTNGLTGTVDNSGVSITLEQDQLNPVVNGNISYTTGSNGTITGTTATVNLGNNINQATITIAKGELKRKIILRLRTPMVLKDAAFFTPIGGNVANLVAQPCIITFKLPTDIPITDYPIPIYIYTKKLSPDPIIPNSSLLSVDTSPSADFRYVYMAPYLGFDSNNQPIPHYIQFVTNNTSSNETVSLGSDLFATSAINLNTITSLSQINNLSFTPNPAPQVGGTLITVRFTIPNVSYTTAPYSIRIFTSKLEYVSTTSGVSCVWDNNINAYIYTTNSIGVQTLTFKTKNSNNTEVIRVGGDKFAYITGSRY